MSAQTGVESLKSLELERDLGYFILSCFPAKSCILPVYYLLFDWNNLGESLNTWHRPCNSVFTETIV